MPEESDLVVGAPSTAGGDVPADGPRGPENVILSTPRAQQTRRRALENYRRHYQACNSPVCPQVILSTPRAQQTRRRARRWAERAGECYFVDAPSTADEDCFGECGLVGAPSTAEEDCLCLPCTPPGLSSSRCCRGTPLVPAAGTLGPDSVRLAEGAEGLLVDAPTLVEPVLCQLVCQYRR